MSAEQSPDSFTFTVGKLDAGMAILLGERAHLIEFPSILLPPGATTGSIVNIAVFQNHSEEQKREKEFWDLQDAILEEFGQASPEPPKLSVRNVTQTSVTLEWEPIKLATAKIRSLDIYRNGERLSAVPSVMTNTTTKHSGMEINTQYTFQLILRTTAGTYPSNILQVRTHTMQDTSGICVCFGSVQDPVLLENAKLALREMGAKWTDKLQIDTSHFVCTNAVSYGGTSPSGMPSVEYQRALQLSVPIVQPFWILACHTEKRMVPIANFYLGVSTPSSATFNRPVSMSQASLHRSPVTPTANQPSKLVPSSHRASMPVPSRSPNTPSPRNSAFIGQNPSTIKSQRTLDSPKEEQENENDPDLHTAQLENAPDKRKSRTGSINKNFRFPPVSSNTEGDDEDGDSISGTDETGEEGGERRNTVTENFQQQSGQHGRKPSAIEVPPPPPIEKESSFSTLSLVESMDDDVGPTEEISLN